MVTSTQARWTAHITAITSPDIRGTRRATTNRAIFGVVCRGALKHVAIERIARRVARDRDTVTVIASGDVVADRVARRDVGDAHPVVGIEGSAVTSDHAVGHLFRPDGVEPIEKGAWV